MHLVSLLEDMPVTETIEAIAHLRETKLPVGTIIVNAATESRLPPASLAPAAEGRLDTARLAAGLKQAGIPSERRRCSRVWPRRPPTTRSGCSTRPTAATSSPRRACRC